MTTNAAPPNSRLDFLNCLRSSVASYPLSSQISNTSLRFLRLRMNATIPDTCAARISKTGAPVAGNKADNTEGTSHPTASVPPILLLRCPLQSAWEKWDGSDSPGPGCACRRVWHSMLPLASHATMCLPSPNAFLPMLQLKQMDRPRKHAVLDSLPARCGNQT